MGQAVWQWFGCLEVVAPGRRIRFASVGLKCKTRNRMRSKKIWSAEPGQGMRNSSAAGSRLLLLRIPTLSAGWLEIASNMLLFAKTQKFVIF